MIHCACPNPNDIRSSLTLLDAELYDDAIPFEDTARRLISVSEVAAQVIAANVTRLPNEAARLLALSVRAVYRRDLLAARDFIIDALDRAVVAPRKGGSQ